MKKFTLEEYLKNPDKKVITRDGRNARIICTDVKRVYYPILALVDNGTFEGSILYTKNGEYNIGEESSPDLFFAPEKHEGWINIYKFSREGSTYHGSTIWSTEEEAKGAANSNLAATIKIEWEE